MRPEIADVKILDPNLVVHLSNGRTLSASLNLFPRLQHASTDQRNNWFIIAGGIGVHWPDLDEDITLRTLLELAPGKP
jgi:hypothetical protein